MSTSVIRTIWQARELVRELEFDSINWLQVHKLWALERPDVAVCGDIAHAEATAPYAASFTPSSWTGFQKKRDRPGVAQGSRGAPRASSPHNCKRPRHHTEESHAGDGGGRRACSSSVDKDAPHHEASIYTSENVLPDAGAGWGGSPTLGSLVEVRLDDDTTALAIVSDVPRNHSNPNKGGSRYEVTFLDDQGRLALRDRLELSLPNEFVDVVFECDPMYMQVLHLCERVCVVCVFGAVCVRLRALKRERHVSNTLESWLHNDGAGESWHQ